MKLTPFRSSDRRNPCRNAKGIAARYMAAGSVASLARDGLALVLCGGLAASCLRQSGTCEELATCPDCTDPTWASDHPDLCPLGPSDAEAREVAAADASDGTSSGSNGRDDASDDAADASRPGQVGDANPANHDGDAGTGSTGEQAVDGEAGPQLPPCDPTASPSVASCVIDERFGVFVTPAGDDEAAGTRAAPLRTLTSAIQKSAAMHLRVYACDGSVGFAEGLTIDPTLGSVALFGGFSCASSAWIYSTLRRSVVSPATGPALVISAGSSGVLLEDFELDGAGAVGPGATSLGAMVDAAAGVVLRRVRIVAGQASAGTPGIDGTRGVNGASPAAGQVGRDATCADGGIPFQIGGLWLTPSACGSKGGTGGTAFQGSTGGTGSAGVPAGANNGGALEQDGIRGLDGTAGSIGPPGASSGVFTPSGYQRPAAAGSGTDGIVAQGGGGGGASNAFGVCVGASGGAGGMGGCGGRGGTGGGSGGASDALLAWMSDVNLDHCELVAGSGGAGGRGGNGGPGGVGAAGARGGAGIVGINRAGMGGTGGTGGSGGPGAGGSGGPSYALVFRGPTPLRTATSFMAGPGGASGIGGTALTSSTAVKAPDGSAGPVAMEFALLQTP